VESLYKEQTILYKAILKPIWTYGMQLWGTAPTSNIQILKRFQSKALRMIVNAPWLVPNMVIRRDLQTPAVKEEICRYSSQYSAVAADFFFNCWWTSWSYQTTGDCEGTAK
jgi:hypothetical protein